MPKRCKQPRSAEPIQLPLFPDQASLIRIRPEWNEWRFYRMAVWPDLFGCALLARQWGRIGTQGRVRLDPARLTADDALNGQFRTNRQVTPLSRTRSPNFTRTGRVGLSSKRRTMAPSSEFRSRKSVAAEIANMEIFCLDLALVQLMTKRVGGPGFLLHDSHLFDAVDERQIARALLLGGRATTGRGLQYIVTMNSDIFDRLPLAEEIERSKVVLPTRLSNETETGGLFGFRVD